MKKSERFVIRFNKRIYPKNLVEKFLKNLDVIKKEEIEDYIIVEAKCTEEEAYEIFSKILGEMI